MGKELLIVFVRNLIPGRVKTRLAKSIGNELAINVYKKLLQHTDKVISQTKSDLWIFYSEFIPETSLIKTSNESFVQVGSDLGEKMYDAFEKGFDKGYDKIVLIGSDLFELQTSHINAAFKLLGEHDFVIGPAKDGGYYLIGQLRPHDRIFKDKSWGEASVLEHTLNDLKDETVFLLEALNDIDTIEDLKAHPKLFESIKQHD